MSRENWRIEKPAVKARGGVVVSQHSLASEVGAAILRDGGNATDAAIATSFAIGVVEPWMSGLGGGGVMVSLSAGPGAPESIFFGMRASRNLDPADYPLSGGTGGDLFAWPAVVDDRNVHGPLSVALPGQVAGMAEAHRRQGSLPWAELLQPAIDLCRAGFEADWHATLRIAAAASAISRDPTSAALYLPGGYVPAGQWGGPPPLLKNPRLADTLDELARNGRDSFYGGELARAIVTDAQELGIALDATDLRDYRAQCLAPLAIGYGDAMVLAPAGLTGGPTLEGVLGRLTHPFAGGAAPTAEDFRKLIDALSEEFGERLSTIGHDAVDPACTSHISVADRHGNMVSLTQTLLSVFGAKLTLPRTGILMNNGIMWFDPRPGRANSIAPGALPLSNMCPVVIERKDGSRVALGGSGGRRIIGAVAQMVCWLLDFDMDLEQAMMQPRVDVSGSTQVLLDLRLPEEVRTSLAAVFDTRSEQSMVYPNLYGCPNCVAHSPTEGASGVPFPFSPVSAAAGA